MFKKIQNITMSTPFGVIPDHGGENEGIRMVGGIKNTSGIRQWCSEPGAGGNNMCHPAIAMRERTLNELCMELLEGT